MEKEINLLPPTLQHWRARRLFAAGVGQVVRRLIAALVITLGMFGATYVALEQILATQSLPDDATAINQEQTEQIRRANTLITTIQAHRQNTPWTPQVEEVLELLPQQLKLTKLVLDEKSKKLTIAGIFSERAAVTTFEQSLKSLPWVKQVEAPLKNFATGDATDFTLIVERKEAPR